MPYVSRNGNGNMNITRSGSSITITGRSGRAQGLQFRLDEIAPREGHEYYFRIAGNYGTAAGVEVAIGRGDGSDGVQSDQLAKTTTGANGSFSITLKRTYNEIISDLATIAAHKDRGRVYSFGSSSSTTSDVVLTTFSLEEVNPEAED
jgi:hypothetical protein